MLQCAGLIEQEKKLALSQDKIEGRFGTKK